VQRGGVQQMVTRHFDVTAEEFDAIYTGHGKGFIGGFLDRFLREDMYERFRLTIEAAGDEPGRTVLDVGCGTGRFAIALAQRGAQVVGLDPAPTMLKIARQLAEEHGVSARCAWAEGDIEHFTTNRTFDYVLGIGLFDYLSDPVSALRRMVGLASKRVVLSFPRRWTYRAPIRKVRLLLRGCPVFFYDRKQVMQLVEEAGGAVERFEVVGKLYFVTVKPAPPKQAA
jgi:ubiquinone/menaquinone biosynthesis C-methylase UbiE